MCTLRLGVLNCAEPLDVPVACEYQRVAVDWVESLSKRATWPKTEIARLELWEDEPPLVLRMDNVYMASVEQCPDYRAYRRAHRETEAAQEEQATEAVEHPEVEPHTT